MFTQTRQRVRAAVVAVGAGVIGIAAPSAQAACTADWTDPRDLYGEQVQFDVYRKGDRVGSHTVRFREQGERLIVDTKFNVEVSLLFITAYRYTYTSTEIWRNGCLETVRAVTNDDGSRSSVDARATASGIKIQGPSGVVTSQKRLFPTNHWNADVLASDAVLNTITGKVDEVDIVDRGLDSVKINGAVGEARRFSYTGDLTTDVWYDDSGRWVKMRFTAKDGSEIEYVCRSCRRPGHAA